jgi:hypothetical protein
MGTAGTKKGAGEAADALTSIMAIADQAAPFT